jgi:hypothetical protein
MAVDSAGQAIGHWPPPWGMGSDADTGRRLRPRACGRGRAYLMTTAADEITLGAQPSTIDLGAYAADRGLALSPVADTEKYGFYLMDLPVSLAVPAGRELTRLRLTLEAATVGGSTDPVVAHDVFPAAGQAGAAAPDVSPALLFAPPAPGTLGLRLAPVSWPAGSVTWPERLANPVCWEAGQAPGGAGLSAYVIWRAPRQVPVKVSVSLTGQLATAAPDDETAQVSAASHYFVIPS